MAIRYIKRAAPLIETLPAAQYSEVLRVLNNVLEYSVGDVHTLTTLRTMTTGYCKAISDVRKTEFYFPFEYLRLREGGGFLRIQSVLKREDRTAWVKCDKDGMPVQNLKLVDDMRQCDKHGRPTGRIWRVGFKTIHTGKIMTPGQVIR